MTQISGHALPVLQMNSCNLYCLFHEFGLLSAAPCINIFAQLPILLLGEQCLYLIFTEAELLVGTQEMRTCPHLSFTVLLGITN